MIAVQEKEQATVINFVENKKQMVCDEQLKQIRLDAMISQQAAFEARQAIVARFHT